MRKKQSGWDIIVHEDGGEDDDDDGDDEDYVGAWIGTTLYKLSGWYISAIFSLSLWFLFLFLFSIINRML